MTKRRGKDRSQKRHSSPDSSRRASLARSVSLKYWGCLSLLLILGANPHWIGETVRLIPPPVDGVLAPENAWSVPAARLSEVETVVEWPFWLFAVVSSLVIAMLASRVASATTVWLAALGLLIWSVTIHPEDLIPGLSVLALAMVIEKYKQENPRPVISVVWVCLLLTIGLVSIEFGLLYLFAILLLLPIIFDRQARDRRKFNPPRVGLCLMLLLPALGCLFPGYLSSLLRPVNWLWLHPQAQLQPLDGVELLSDSHGAAPLLVAIFVFGLLCQITRERQNSWPYWLLIVSAILIGFGCGHFLWVCSCAIAVAMGAARVEPRTPSRLDRLILLGLFLVACVRIAIQLPQVLEYALDFESHPHRIDPTAWGTEGNVVLMDLDQSSDWQSADVRKSFRLMLNDRWDVYGDRYAEYAGFCRDLDEVRRDSYLRTDGAWGGYQRFVNEFSPALIVTDSSNHHRIRRMMMSTDWSLMGIDSRRTIFGWKDRTSNLPQIQRCLNTLFRLEWPGRDSVPLNENTIVVASPEDRRIVADVLCAARFPYAALRVLPVDSRQFTEKIRTMCLIELAHRVRRHSGRSSLLDQSRAVSRVRAGRRNSIWTRDELLQIAHSLENFGLFDLAVEFANESLSRWFFEDRDPAHQLRTETLIRRCRDRPLEFNDLESEYDLIELELRIALLRGDTTETTKLLTELPLSLREYYHAIAQSGENSLEELSTVLIHCINSPEFPARLRGEALFFLGCTAIELGDSDGALAVFEQGERTAPNSPFSSLRRMHFGQLMKNR